MSSLDLLWSTGFTFCSTTQRRICRNKLQGIAFHGRNKWIPDLRHFTSVHPFMSTWWHCSMLKSEIPLKSTSWVLEYSEIQGHGFQVLLSEYSLRLCLFPVDRYECLCVCASVCASFLIHMHQQVIRDCCASLSWEAAFHLFLKCSVEWFCSRLMKLMKLVSFQNF